MGYLKKKKNNGLFEFFTVVSFLISYFSWLYTNKVTIGISAFTVIMAINIGLKIFIDKIVNKQMLESGIYDIDRMDGEKFEEYMLVLFKKQGYTGYLTRSSGDYGADIVIEKSGIRCVVQAKRWKERVGIAAIQQVIGAIKHYNAQKALAVTNSYFTKNAIELANSNNVELWDRNYIISNIKRLDNVQVYSQQNTQELICPECNGQLIRRIGKNGSFYGCSNFPKCRHTKNI